MIRTVHWQFQSGSWTRNSEKIEGTLAVPFDEDLRWVWIEDFAKTDWPPLSAETERLGPAACWKLGSGWDHWMLVWSDIGNGAEVWLWMIQQDREMGQGGKRPAP